MRDRAGLNVLLDRTTVDTNGRKASHGAGPTPGERLTTAAAAAAAR